MREFYDSFNGNKLKLVFGSLLKTIEAIFELLIPLYIARIINEGIVFSDENILYRCLFIMIIFYVLGYICSIVSQYFSSLVASNVGKNIRNKVLFRRSRGRCLPAGSAPAAGKFRASAGCSHLRSARKADSWGKVS